MMVGNNQKMENSESTKSLILFSKSHLLSKIKIS